MNIVFVCQSLCHWTLWLLWFLMFGPLPIFPSCWDVFASCIFFCTLEKYSTNSHLERILKLHYRIDSNCQLMAGKANTIFLLVKKKIVSGFWLVIRYFSLLNNETIFLSSAVMDHAEKNFAHSEWHSLTGPQTTIAIKVVLISNGPTKTFTGKHF